MRNAWKRVLTLTLALALAVVLAAPALAVVPDRPENQYVLDQAGVLSEETEQEIISQNQKLFQETGAQIVVVAVDFLDGEEIDDYAYSLFNTWGIGSVERNNGLLLLMAIAEDNYYATSGYGIEDYFDGAKLKEMLTQYLKPDFAAKDYDAGTRKFFDAALSEMESYYAGYSDQYNSPGAEQEYGEDYGYTYEPSFGERVGWMARNVLSMVVRIVVVVVIFAVLVALLRGMSGRGGGPRSGGGGGGGGFWTGLFLGNMLGSSRRRGGWRPPPPGGFGPRPPRGGGGFGGFHGGGGGGFGGGFRGGGGGFHGGGGSRGGGAGR